MRNRALQVRMVRADAPSDGDQTLPPVVTPQEIDAIIKGQVQNIAMTVGALMLTKKAADTVSELILIAGRKYI